MSLPDVVSEFRRKAVGRADTIRHVRPGWLLLAAARIEELEAEVADREALLDIDLDRQPRIVDVSDQLPYGDFTAGRWAWLLDDVKPTTERCPACMGKVHPTGLLRPGEQAMGRTYGDLIPCPQFFRAGTCPPIPAKGRQGLWTWAP